MGDAPPRRRIMNARSVLALFAVVLVLFVISASALSRTGPTPGVDRFSPSQTIDGQVADDGPIDGPEDLPSGDDDNWEKPAPNGQPTIEDFGADGQRCPLGPEPPGEKSPGLVSCLRVQLRLALRASWVFFGIR
jgi:hypothetical protein